MAATLIKAILDYYTSDSSAAAAAIRTALGTSKMFRDRADDLGAMPYCILRDPGSKPIDSECGYDYYHRIDSCPIVFDIFSVSANTCETVIDAIENAFVRSKAILTVTNCVHIKTNPVSKQTFEDIEPNVWHGVLELDFRLQK